MVARLMRRAHARATAPAAPIEDQCPYHAGNLEARCTCPLADRCSDQDERGHQCVLGAGHKGRHATAAGQFWR
jgi:hypothetical protein